ncbi:VOC family protein [Nocardioides sp. Iso805N]|uniref:VOC family protein n=1 Tax=Nocardioides sp. Iso805N TaxID=1283287 RepID=UPI003FA44F83
MTTKVLSVTVPVPDQDRALAFYRDVLGCEVRYDGEPWPGARMIEVVPPDPRSASSCCRPTARSRSR